MNYFKQIPHKLAIIWCFVMRRAHGIIFFPLRDVPLCHEIIRDGWKVQTPSQNTS